MVPGFNFTQHLQLPCLPYAFVSDTWYILHFQLGFGQLSLTQKNLQAYLAWLIANPLFIIWTGFLCPEKGDAWTF